MSNEPITTFDSYDLVELTPILTGSFSDAHTYSGGEGNVTDIIAATSRTCSSNPEKQVSTKPKDGLHLTRVENKKARNSNQIHYDYKGRCIEGRKFDDSFKCNCTMQCDTKVAVEERRHWFESYWRLGEYEAQSTMIANMVKEYKKKRCYGDDNARRSFSRTYHLSDVIVCREMFIKTLGITSKRVNTSLRKSRLNSLEDRRGLGQTKKKKMKKKEKTMTTTTRPEEA